MTKIARIIILFTSLLFKLKVVTIVLNINICNKIIENIVLQFTITKLP